MKTFVIPDLRPALASVLTVLATVASVASAQQAPTLESMQREAQAVLADRQLQTTIIEVPPGQSLRPEDHPGVRAGYVLDSTTAFDAHFCEPLVLPVGRKFSFESDLPRSGLVVTGSKPLRMVLVHGAPGAKPASD